MRFFKISCVLIAIIFLCISGCSKENEKNQDELNQKALQLLKQNNPKDALKIIRTAVKKVEDEYGNNHPKLIASLEIAGLVHQALGDYQNAESIYQRALTLIKHANGPDSPEAAKILNTLGGLYYSQNRYLDAAKTFRQSLSIAQNLFPDNDPRLNTLRKNIKTCEDLLNSDVPASAQASAEKPALSGPIQDLVPDQIKRSMISQLAQQKIFISDLSPRMPVSMDDKGMVFPYHGLKKDKTGNSQEILLLFAAIRNPDKPAALIFQQCRLISYRSYINTMEQGGLAQFKKALMEVFADLYPKSV